MNRLRSYARDTWSQNGEDGILEEILRRMHREERGSCVEFGAWDGMHLSNTFALVQGRGWSAIYIEADSDRFADLTQTAARYPRITPIHARVGRRAGESRLDDLLASTGCPADFDVLSVDIDSDDLEVWADLVQFRPKIVIIETNASVPPGIVQWHSTSVRQPGNSFSAVLRVAKEKRYTLVCHTLNAFLVADEYADEIGLDELDRRHPERLYCWDRVHRPLTVENVTFRVRTLVPDLVRRGRSLLRH